MIGISGKSTWRLAIFAIFLLALVVRWYYLNQAQVQQPIRGDAIQYYSYAWNLVHHGVFSSALPNSDTVVADSYRDPGYPLFLAAWMGLTDSQSAWYAPVLLSQGLLGALSVLFAMLLARRWLRLPWLIVAGLLMAIWPHGITINGYLLSETLFGFLTILGLLLIDLGIHRRHRLYTLAGGFSLGAAGLSNAILLPFGPLAAIVLWVSRPQLRQCALLLLLASLALPTAWAVRNSTLPPGQSATGRATLNLVQGSWPQYHTAHLQSLNGDGSGRLIMAQIQQEYDLLSKQSVAGARAILQRMMQSPGQYLGWYASKPALLWDWSIRIGQDDIHVFPTRESPFQTVQVYQIIAALCHGLNPVLFILMIAGGILVLVYLRPDHPGAMLAVGCVFFITLVYAVFQSEPRYSIAFRPLQMLLAGLAIQEFGNRFLPAIRGSK